MRRNEKMSRLGWRAGMLHRRIKAPGERPIRKDEHAKHLDELIMECEGSILKTVTVFQKRGGDEQQLSSANGNSSEGGRHA
jgi:hypothetical protein